MLVVSLEHLYELHELHNHYLLAPEKRELIQSYSGANGKNHSK